MIWGLPLLLLVVLPHRRLCLVVFSEESGFVVSVVLDWSCSSSSTTLLSSSSDCIGSFRDESRRLEDRFVTMFLVDFRAFASKVDMVDIVAADIQEDTSG